MDTFTHAIAGAAIGKLAYEKKLGRLGMLAGTLFAVFPDSDYIALSFNHRLYLKYHRSFMNSFLFLIPFSLIFAVLLVRTSGIKRFWTFFSLASVELLSHISLDLMTSSGSSIFFPLSFHRYSTDTIFPFDFIITSLFLMALIFAFICKSQYSKIMRIFFILLVSYLGLCEFYHGKAITLAKGFALVSGLGYQRVAALPQPFSPFRWSNIIETESGLYQGSVDFLKKPGNDQERLWLWRGSASQYRSPSRMHYRLWQKFDDPRWIEKTLDLEGVKLFYWLARFPVARTVAEVNDHHLVEFLDLRFFMIKIPLSFSYQVELDENGKVIKEGFKEI
jgi:inner membrane protein